MATIQIGGPDGVDQEITEATVLSKNESWYLLYKETLPGWENTSTKIKCRPGFLEMTRTGPKNTRMVFEEGKLFYMKYPTPYGEIDLEYFTESVLITTSGEGTRVHVTYTIVGDEETKRTLYVNWYERPL